MDTLTAVNAGLAGLFAFAAIHYAVTWWFSRDERVLLLFSIQCGIYVAACLVIASYFHSTTVPEAQFRLNWIVTFGAVTHAVVLHYYALLGKRRDSAFRWAVTSVMAVLAVLSQLTPMRGTVVELQTAQLPWGGTGLVPVLTPSGAPLALLYFTILAIHGYGLFIAGTIWKRDRAGAVLVAAGSSAVLVGAEVGILIDFAKVQAPYMGALPHAIFVVFMALYLAREYAARGARLAASERRAALALRETHELLVELEESEAARHSAIEALVQAERKGLVSQLAAGVAHDFGHVLSVIGLYSHRLLDGSAAPNDHETARQGLAEAQAQGQELSRQLVALARSDSRSVKRFPLDRPVRAAAQTLTAALPRNISFTYEAPAVVDVEADEAEIQQVIYNLVLNARDAMPQGGSINLIGGMETSSAPIEVVGGTLAAGCWGMLSVADTGPGVDPAIRERIFDMFFTTKGNDGGTGIGLATVLRIAKANGGGVALCSAQRAGATFTVYLPGYRQDGASSGTGGRSVGKT